MSHSAAPWKVTGLDGDICGPSRLLVCTDVGTEEAPERQAVAIVVYRPGETDGNAAVIAGAPRLLSALQGLVHALEQGGTAAMLTSQVYTALREANDAVRAAGTE